MIWIPKIVFANSQEKIYIKHEPLSTLLIMREDDPIRKFSFELNEYEEFEGKDNALIYENVFALKFTCNFDLHLYPFDTQHCKIMVRCFHFFITLKF